jgi:acyl-CoA thioester hydrolase
MTAPESRMDPSISGTSAPEPVSVSVSVPQPVELELKVRDYECDMDHVVNNAVYLNYLEHARHELLQARGLKFGELSKRGISLVVTRIEVDYKGSLVSGDAFIVRTTLQRSGRIRFHFKQSIHRVADNRLMLNAVVIGTALNAQGRPELPAELDKAFD